MSEKQRDFVKRPFILHVFFQSLVITDDPCTSDKDTTNERCGKMFRLHSYEPTCEEDSTH